MKLYIVVLALLGLGMISPQALAQQGGQLPAGQPQAAAGPQGNASWSESVQGAFDYLNTHRREVGLTAAAIGTVAFIGYKLLQAEEDQPVGEKKHLVAQDGTPKTNEQAVGPFVEDPAPVAHKTADPVAAPVAAPVKIGDLPLAVPVQATQVQAEAGKAIKAPAAQSSVAQPSAVDTNVAESSPAPKVSAREAKPAVQPVVPSKPEQPASQSGQKIELPQWYLNVGLLLKAAYPEVKAEEAKVLFSPKMAQAYQDPHQLMLDFDFMNRLDVEQKFAFLIGVLSPFVLEKLAEQAFTLAIALSETKPKLAKAIENVMNPAYLQSHPEFAQNGLPSFLENFGKEHAKQLSADELAFIKACADQVNEWEGLQGVFVSTYNLIPFFENLR